MTVSAAEAAVGLAIIIAIFRHRQTVNLQNINLMKRLMLIQESRGRPSPGGNWRQTGSGFCRFFPLLGFVVNGLDFFIGKHGPDRSARPIRT